jgi:hypothetical protein
MRPALVVTIDTEEEGLWSGRYRATGNPLVDYPVATDPTDPRLVRDRAADGRCEIGAHLHPCPRGEEVRWSFPHQLAPWQQEVPRHVGAPVLEA